MPHFCPAYGCSNKRSFKTRARGITFHSFPQNAEKRRQWELALRRDGYVASKNSKLCSKHFRSEDFDRTGQTVRLKAGVVPTIFNFPAHLQRPVATRSTAASRRAEENLPMDLHQGEPPPDQGSLISELTKKRRMAWISAVRRPELTFKNVTRHMMVCSQHFHTGRPAYEMNETHPDWAPSLQLGHTEAKSPDTERFERRTKRQRIVTTVSGATTSLPPPTPDVDEDAAPAVAPQRSEQRGAAPQATPPDEDSQTVMSGNSCCVKNCHQFSHDEDGKSLNNGLTFFSFPAWRRNEGSEISELTMKRRSAWVAAVGRSNITFSHIPTSTRVCSRHFHSGKPAYERLQSDPDWAPSLELGHNEGNGRYAERLPLSIRDKESKKKKKKEKELKKTAKKRQLDISRPRLEEAEVAAAGGEARKGVGGPVKETRSWNEVRSLLLSVLKSESISNQQPVDQTHQETVHVRKETDFKDFFRKSLEESLENFSKSRTPLTQEPSIYVELKEDLSLRILPVKDTSKEASSSSSSSSSCGNCVRLQRKVVELQEEMSLLTGGQEDMDVPPISNTTQVHTDQVPLSPDMAQTEEEVPDWAESLGGGHEKRQRLSSSSRNLANIHSPKDKPRPTLRFKKVWLRMFGFLRYSPSLNVMWCHICRLYHDKRHQDNGMIKGSRCLKLDNIKSHSASIYHKKNMERYMKHMSNLNPLDSNCSNRSSEENI